MRFFGIEIEKKTDILAFAAFLLSVSSIMYQVTIYFRGPQVSLGRPREIILYMQQPPGTNDIERRRLTFVSTTTYVNSAPPGKNAVVLNQIVNFTLNGKQYNYDWYQFVTLSFKPPSTNEMDRKELGVVESKTASPFVVPAGGAEAREIWFGPRFNEEFINPSDIRREFTSVMNLNKQHIFWSFRFKAEYLNDDNDSELCNVKITSNIIENILTPEIGWASLSCVAPEP